MAFHTIVCIKSVMRAASKGAGRRTPENSELNPFDRPALEAALQLKDEQGGSVTALSMGPAVATEALVEARAMGVDRAVLLCDAALAGSDTYVTSRVLAEAARRLSPFDFLLFGTRAADSDTGQVGPQTATAMEIPFVSGVRRMIPAGERWQAERLMDDWEEVWQVRTPAAVTIHAAAYAPRPIALGGIARANDHLDVERWSLAHLDLAVGMVGLDGSPTRVSALQVVKTKRNCHMIEGEAGEQAASLVEKLTTQGLMAS